MAFDGETTTATANRVAAVRVGPEHVAALAEFYRAVWDPAATPESVRAGRETAASANPVTPGEPPPTWLVVQNGRAIAHVTTIPIRIWLQGRERPAYWMKGLWVLPEFRRSSAGFLVLRAAASEALPALALVHERAAIRLFEALGFSNLGALPDRLRVLRPGALFARLDLDTLGVQGAPGWLRLGSRIARIGAPVFAPLVGVAGGLWSTLGTGRLGNLTIDVDAACDRLAVEDLWDRVRAELVAGPVRGGSQLAERYVPDAGYVFVHVRSRSRLVGIGIVKRPRKNGDPRLGGLRIATLADLLYSPSDPRAGLALLAGAERAARGLGADALLCSATIRAMHPLLFRRAYVRLPSTLHVLARFPREPQPPPGCIDEWWFTRGDSEGDGSF